MDKISLDGILGMDGNAAAFGRLQELLKEGSATAFIGAGASAPLFPLWGELIKGLAHEPVRLGLAKQADEEYWLRNAASKPLRVASQIRAKLGDATYHAFLYETFKERIGTDGFSHTPAQAALMRLNCKSYITTNYDAGLPEARRVLNTNIADTSFTVWNQNCRVNEWLSGDFFKTKPSRPILFAHGHFTDPDNIILDQTSYQRAYQSGPYRRLFQNLWCQERLVFVGFSFNDATLVQIADEVLSETVKKGGGEPRHIAIIGLPTDQAYSEELRREYLEAYHAHAIFYPVFEGEDGRPDHSALNLLLESLCEDEAEPPGKLPQLKTTNAGLKDKRDELHQKPIPSLFVHESTDDEKFTGRINELDRLHAWAEDPKVRLIAVSAIGGLGKTSLMGKWLRDVSDTHAHDSKGVFFWSFYRDHSSQNLYEALCKFGTEKFRQPPPRTSKDAQKRALSFLSEFRIVVVLDGLEVIQEAPGSLAFGKLLQVDLAEFLHDHCRSAGGSILILTSRFPFPDLTPHLGGPLRPLALPSLDPVEGAKLLYSFGVRGSNSDRERVSQSLGGHPLALRIFARSMPSEFGGDPTRLWQRVFDHPHLESSDSLEGKLRRLLSFYENRLPEQHRQALSLVALFRMPVGKNILSPLWTKLFGSSENRGSLERTLDELHAEHLLTADSFIDDKELRYTCHPILRDHFRTRLLCEHKLALKAANLLADQPDAHDTRSLAGVSIISIAIETLLEAGEVIAANEIFLTRLDNGQVFSKLSVPHVGLEVAGHFVRDDDRQTLVGEKLGLPRLGFFLRLAALFAMNAGEPEAAYRLFLQAEKLCRRMDDRDGLGLTLGRLAEIQMSLGNIRVISETNVHIDEALAFKVNSHSADLSQYAGFIALLQGELTRTDALFEKAGPQKRKRRYVGFNVEGLGVFAGPEFLIRTGKLNEAEAIVRLTKNYCSDQKATQQKARCELILARIKALQGEWNPALVNLKEAKGKFENGHMIYDLVCALAVEATICLGEEKWGAAEAAIERAVQMAAPRRYRLVQADLLNLRARLWLEKPTSDSEASRARDDAESALQLAEFCGYAWAERDALALLALSMSKLGYVDEAIKFDQRFNNWDRRLKALQPFWD